MKKGKLVSNSFAMLANRLVQSIATFILSATIARVLGPEVLGQYLLAFSYYFIFVTIFSQGLKTLFTRELSRSPDRIPTFLVNGSFLQFLISLVGYFLLIAIVFILPYSDESSVACYIMGLAIIPFSLSNITEAIFQAQERMHLIAASTVPIYILRLLFMLLIIHHGINYLALTIVISECLVLVVEWILLTKTIKPIWKIKPDFMWKTLGKSRTFFAIEGVAVVNDRLQLLILSVFGSEFLVGLYGSIAQLMQPLSIVSNSVTLAIFPEMSKTTELGSGKQRQLTENILKILLCISLPFMVGIFYFGEDLLTFIYGKSKFHEAAIALHFTALTLPLFPFSRVFSYVLVANSLEKINLIEVISTTLIGGLTGILLIPKYQLLGAVAVDLTMMLVSFSLYAFTVYKRLFSINPLKVFYYPVLISILMAFECYILKQLNANFPSVLVITISSYCVIIGLLGVHIFDGHRGFIERFLIKK